MPEPVTSPPAQPSIVAIRAASAAAFGCPSRA